MAPLVTFPAEMHRRAMHGQEPRIPIALLASAHAIHRRLRVHCPRTNGGIPAVVDPAARNALKDPERLPVRVKQHLMRLQQIGPDQKRPTASYFKVMPTRKNRLANGELVVLMTLQGIDCLVSVMSDFTLNSLTNLMVRAWRL